MDILLTHGYFLYQDPHEMQIMKPYPPLGILYISSYLKQQGFDVSVFDTTFSSNWMRDKADYLIAPFSEGIQFFFERSISEFCALHWA